MLTKKNWLRFSGPLALLLATGCAPAYHSYSSRCVECRYCPPRPLPYESYNECVCHSHVAAPHLRRVVAPQETLDAMAVGPAANHAKAADESAAGR